MRWCGRPKGAIIALAQRTHARGGALTPTLSPTPLPYRWLARRVVDALAGLEQCADPYARPELAALLGSRGDARAALASTLLYMTRELKRRRQRGANASGSRRAAAQQVRVMRRLADALVDGPTTTVAAAVAGVAAARL